MAAPSQNADPTASAPGACHRLLVRGVVLAGWQVGKRYKDRHQQGVIYYRHGRPDRFGIYKSHRTIEGAIQSASDLNRASYQRDELVFEAVHFISPNTEASHAR
jgi:hypothetical protein